MKILLVQPPVEKTDVGSDVYIHEPLALEYVGAGVSDRYPVKLFDMRLETNFEQVLREYHPDIVGLTAFTFQVNRVKRICGQIKNYDPHILTVVGGHHATMSPQDFLDRNIDLIVMGEGVFTFREIVETFETKGDFHTISGLAFREDDHLRFTEPRTYPDLDAIPFPDRSLTGHIRERYFSEWYKPMASLRTSKGCPFRCKFCSLWKESQGRYMPREPRAIVAELKTIRESFVFFSDDESFVDRKRMEELADLIREAGLQKEYFMYVRADTVLKFPELMKKWRDIGLVRVLIGFESHRERDLSQYNKKSTTDTNEKAISILRELGISIYASFIIHPDFTGKDFQDLAEYVAKLQLESPYFSVLTPFPGSELYDEVKEQLTTNNYDLFDFCHAVLPTTLPLQRFYAEIYHLYVKSAQNSVSKELNTHFAREMLQRFTQAMNKQKKAYLHHQVDPDRM